MTVVWCCPDCLLPITLSIPHSQHVSTGPREVTVTVDDHHAQLAMRAHAASHARDV